MNRSSDTRRDGPQRWAIAIAGLLLVIVFTGLGVWQLERLSWKLGLIAQVNARVDATPMAAPGPLAWGTISAASDEYRHVRAGGVFDHGKETLVQAVTEVGPGFWVMTPLLTDEGFKVLVNRGFVPQEKSLQTSRRDGLVLGHSRVTGLLRISEPYGGFLRANRPELGRWYSRDVAAIARTHGLGTVAPYFIDADATPNPGGWPRGGLTVIRFGNNHLSYALTWFAMAGMVAIWGTYAAVAAIRAFDQQSRASLATSNDQPN